MDTDSPQSTNPSFPILVVDDEISSCRTLELLLNDSGFDHVITTTDSSGVLEQLEKTEPKIGIVLLDLLMPVINGGELLVEIKKRFPEVIVVIVSGNNEIQMAVDCMRNGAFDYLIKPVDQTRLTTNITRAIEVRDLRIENKIIREHLLSHSEDLPVAFSGIITQNQDMVRLFRYCEAIAKTRQPILITGETGVGKELFARALHDLSGARNLFVPVNIAGVDGNVFSDTLFGHVKGAFTGAVGNRSGLVEKAAGGTLFLDEIGDLTEESQVKLLRLIQENEYTPLGDDTSRRTRARIIVATHKDLLRLINEETFRRDLFYRLQTHHIHIPPLRERKDDFPLLVDFLIEQTARELRKKKPTYPPELITLLKNYTFPGNVRELKSMIYDAVSEHKSMILSTQSFRKHVSANMARHDGLEVTEHRPSEDETMRFPETLPTLRETGELLIREAMQRADGNQTIAAGMLGISQQALSLRLKKMKNR